MAQIIRDLITQPLAGEDLLATEAVYISDGTGVDSARTAGSAYKLEVTTAGRDTFAGFVKADALTGANVKIVNSGRVKGFTGLTSGKTIWGDPATPGAYLLSEPSVSVPLGIAESATVIIATSKFGKQDNLSGKAIIDPSRSDVKKDTKANLVTYASSATNGQTVYATDTKEFFVITDAALVEVGGAGGAGSVDVLTVIKDFTNSLGLTTVASGVNAGTFRLTHDPALTQFAETTLAVTNKFQGKILALRLDKRSTAFSGNFKVIVTDESNASAVLADDIISPEVAGVLTDKKLVTFSTAQGSKTNPVASIKVRFEALAEAGAPFSEFDDIVVELDTTETRELIAVTQETNNFSARIANNGTASITSQSESFIQSVNRTALGNVDVVFIPGFFTVAPSVIATGSRPSPDGVNVTVVEGSLTSSGFSVVIMNPPNGAGALQDHPFDIHVSRQSSDYKNITRISEREVSTFHEVIQQEADVVVVAGNNLGESITANVTDIPFVLISDTSGGWNGSTFTVPEDGIYNFNITAAFTTDNNRVLDLWKNGSNFYSLGFSNVTPHNGTTSLKLKTGDVISIRVTAGGTLSNISGHNLSITKVGLPKIASVAPDSKVEIPTSELRMEGSSSRGTGAEATTVKFNTIALLRGDAFTVDNTNGTVVTIKKDGKISVNSSIISSGNSTLIISKNATNPAVLPLTSERVVSVTAQPSIFTQISGNIDVKSGDVIRIANDLVPISNVNEILSITHQEQRIQVAVSNVQPQFQDADSMVRLHTGNGHGSVNTKIRRFSALAQPIIGTDITYTDSATDGASFKIEADGFYNISYTDTFNAVSFLGVSKNSTQLSTNISSINISDMISMEASSAANEGSNTSWQGVLLKGDIIRPHTLGSGNASQDRTTFTIAKVGKPSIASVDVTPFVNMDLVDTQYVRYNTAAGYGSFATKVPYFSNAEVNTGNSIISVSNSSVNGFSITALKDCTVDLSYTSTTTASQPTGIAKGNPSVDGATPITSLTPANILAIGETPGSSFRNPSVEIQLVKGETIYPSTRDGDTIVSASSWSINITAQALAEHIVTPPKSNLTDWVDAGPIGLSATTTAPTKGTTAQDSIFWRRVGDSMEIRVEYEQTTGGSAGSGDYLISIPSGHTIDSTKMGRINGAFADIKGAVVGSCAVSNVDGNNLTSAETGVVKVYSSTKVRFSLDTGNTDTFWASNAFDLSGTPRNVSATFSVPIAGWDSGSQFLAAIPKNEFQTKILSTDYSAATSDVAALSFSNLTIGKSYNISGILKTNTAGAAGYTYTFNDQALNTGNVIGKITHGSLNIHEDSISFTFKAQTSQLFLNANVVGVPPLLKGSGTRNDTFITLTELNTTKETTKFS